MRKGFSGPSTFLEAMKPNPQPKSAFDTNLNTDPYRQYDAAPPDDGQHVDGCSFADLRDEMNRRRRDTARRMRGDRLE